MCIRDRYPGFPLKEAWSHRHDVKNFTANCADDLFLTGKSTPTQLPQRVRGDLGDDLGRVSAPAPFSELKSLPMRLRLTPLMLLPLLAGCALGPTVPTPDVHTPVAFEAPTDVTQPVSYTHLDVYKRQAVGRLASAGRCRRSGHRRRSGRGGSRAVT